jgi:hypothetical protein
MEHISDHGGRQNRVTAVLEAGILTFDISITTTLEELAGRLGHLGERHRETLRSVEITKNWGRDAAGHPSDLNDARRKASYPLMLPNLRKGKLWTWTGLSTSRT